MQGGRRNKGLCMEWDKYCRWIGEGRKRLPS